MKTPLIRIALGALAALSLLTPRPAAALASEGAKKPLASAEHEAGGVTVELLEVKRTASDTVTVKWRYRNTTKEAKKLTKESTGWIDPYRLSSESYLLDEEKKLKFSVARDSDRRPVASRNGEPNSWITLKPGKTIETWAKYLVPAGTTKVTVSIEGVPPFEGIAVSE
jgi:hypothetical protein